MARYQVEITSSAAKEFRDLQKPIQSKIAKEIDSFIDNPRPVGVKKLQGGRKEYRVRIGDHRILYTINENEKFVLKTAIRYRREAYR